MYILAMCVMYDTLVHILRLVLKLQEKESDIYANFAHKHTCITCISLHTNSCNQFLNTYITVISFFQSRVMCVHNNKRMCNVLHVLFFLPLYQYLCMTVVN